jgi:hypothetical protein
MSDSQRFVDAIVAANGGTVFTRKQLFEFAKNTNVKQKVVCDVIKSRPSQIRGQVGQLQLCGHHCLHQRKRLN